MGFRGQCDSGKSGAPDPNVLSWEEVGELIEGYAFNRDWPSVAACLNSAGNHWPISVEEPLCSVEFTWSCPEAFQFDEFIDKPSPLSLAVITALRALGHHYSGPSSDWLYPHIITAAGGIVPATWRAAYRLFVQAAAN